MHPIIDADSEKFSPEIRTKKNRAAGTARG
jgi:hypothetical protein